MYRIALIGMPGSGKSTVGRALADHLSLPFVDLDHYIEQTETMSITQIFSTLGEPAFRQMEADALERVYKQFQQGGICSTGGGVVVSEKNRQRLQVAWITIYLEASIGTLVQRLQAEQAHRPLLGQGGEALFERLHALYSARSDWYTASSAHRVIVDGRSISEIVENIVDLLHLSDGGNHV